MPGQKKKIVFTLFNLFLYVKSVLNMSSWYLWFIYSIVTASGAQGRKRKKKKKKKSCNSGVFLPPSSSDHLTDYQWPQTHRLIVFRHALSIQLHTPTELMKKTHNMSDSRKWFTWSKRVQSVSRRGNDARWWIWFWLGFAQLEKRNDPKQYFILLCRDDGVTTLQGIHICKHTFMHGTL